MYYFFLHVGVFLLCFFSICTAQRIELQIILRPPGKGGGVRVCAHSPPWKVIFFCYVEDPFAIFSPCKGLLATFFSLCTSLTIRVGVTDYVAPPPPPQEKHTKKVPTWNKNSKKVPHI